MTKYKIGILPDDKIKKEIIAESKKVLEAIAAKYNCTFEFYQTNISEKAKAVKKNILSTADRVKKKNEVPKTGLSFCGEIDL